MPDNNRKTIYLSGPIMDEHEGVAREWRVTAKQILGADFRILHDRFQFLGHRSRIMSDSIEML